MPFNLLAIRSYSCSTDILGIATKYGKSCRKYILCCVDIAVNALSTAARAVPTTDTQRQFINNMFAVSTTFRTGFPAVNLHQCSTVPLAFIFKLPHQLTPSRVGDAKGQFAVLHHVRNSQVLNRYHLVFAYQSSRQLMQKVFTGIGNPRLHSSNFASRLLTVVRSIWTTRQGLLDLSKLAAQSVKMLGVSYLLLVAGSNQAGDASIQSNLFISYWQWLNRMVFYQQRDKPAPSSIQPHCNSGRLAPHWQQPAPDYIQGLTTLSQPYLPILPFEGRASKLRTTTRVLFLKARVFGSFLEEVTKSGLQVAQCLLQRYTADLIQKLQVFLLLPVSQQRGSLPVVDTLLSLFPRFSTCCQRFVIDQSHTAQSAAQEGFLFRCWCKSVAIGSADHVFNYTTIAEAAFPPTTNRSGMVGVSTPNIR